MKRVKLLKTRIFIILFLDLFTSRNFCNAKIFNKSRRILHKLKKFEKNNKKVCFIGSIKSCEEIHYPYFYLCYKGKLLKIKNDGNSNFNIKDFDTKQIYLLFTSAENIIFDTEETNTVCSIKLISDQNYDFFQLDKENKIDIDEKKLNQYSTWKINKLDLNNSSNLLELPLNTIIFLIDPTSVNLNLENTVWKNNSNIVDLPRINIKTIKDKQKLEKSCLALMNIKPLHAEPEKHENCKDNVKLCMIM